jgi:hypothetical protein
MVGASYAKQLLDLSPPMTEFPFFIYISSHAGKIGNIRWVNADTRYPASNRRQENPLSQRGYWGRCGLVNSPESPDSSPPLP